MLGNQSIPEASRIFFILDFQPLPKTISNRTTTHTLVALEEAMVYGKTFQHAAYRVIYYLVIFTLLWYDLFIIRFDFARY